MISGYEHNAVTRPLHAIPEVEVRVARSPLFDQAGRDGRLPPVCWTRRADAAVCTHVSNVFGFILPIEEIAAAVPAAGGAPDCGRLPVRRRACRWTSRSWGRPSSPCRATRGSTAPRAPACCCAEP